MRLMLGFTVAAALGLTAVSAHAAPVAPTHPQDSNIVLARGGCGWGYHPVPGHWSRWRGWVPPHCAPNRHQYYGNWYGPRYPYAYGYNYYWGRPY